MIIIIPRTKNQLIGAIIFYSLIGAIIVLGAEYNNYLEYKKYGILKDFSSMEGLIVFLKNDDTDTLLWSPSFTCSDFSETLIERGKEKGYRMSKHSLEGSELIKYEESWVSYVESRGYIAGEWGEGDAHAVCEAFVVELNEYVLIEPQNDAIFSKEGYKILYGGGI